MKISKPAILALRGLDHQAKKRIADSLNVHPKTIYRWIQENNDNLTKAAALKVIREETGMTDYEILDEQEPIEVQK